MPRSTQENLLKSRVKILEFLLCLISIYNIIANVLSKERNQTLQIYNMWIDPGSFSWCLCHIVVCHVCCKRILGAKWSSQTCRCPQWRPLPFNHFQHTLMYYTLNVLSEEGLQLYYLALRKLTP